MRLEISHMSQNFPISPPKMLETWTSIIDMTSETSHMALKFHILAPSWNREGASFLENVNLDSRNAI